MDSDATRPRAALPVAGEFELVRKLGSGGFGSVFEARHRPTGLPYAVKRIALSTEDADRFRKEALYPARIASQSLHVLSMHSFFQDEDEGFFYLVTELIPHGDLRRFLATNPSPLPLPQAVDLALGIARGLAAIHEQGIVHRDLKPGNVLMDRKDDRWVPKIADFGLARSSGSVSLGDFASCGYAAPEQVDLSIDPRLGPEADIFAFGMVLYELLTGEKACTAEDLREYGRWARARVAPPPPSTRRPELAARPELDDLVAQLLEFDPDRRTIAATDVTRVLAAVQHGLGSAPPPQSVPETVPKPVLRGTAGSGAPSPGDQRASPAMAPPALRAAPAAAARRSRGAVLAAAAIVVAAGGLAGALWIGSDPQANEQPSPGIADFRAGRYVDALPALLSAADEGDAPSQAALGRMFVNGWGVERNYQEARKWLDRAAAQDDDDARCALGDMYRDGTGVEPQPAEAFKRYVASQDATCGQLGLAHLHLNGLGVPPNYDEALRWYEKAAAASDTTARDRLRELQTGWVMAPLFIGPWQAVGGGDRRAEIDRLRSEGILERVRTTDVRRLRRLGLDFYDGASIYELEVGRPEGQLGVLSYIRHGDRTVLIDGRSPQIHALSASAPIRIDTLERAIAFIRFFMGAIQGDAGIFRVVDTAHDLQWLPPDGPALRDSGRVPFRRLDVQASPSGGWRASSTVVYGSGLYHASLWLKPDGMVEMTEDSPVASALPIAIERFDATGVRVRVDPDPD